MLITANNNCVQFQKINIMLIHGLPAPAKITAGNMAGFVINIIFRL